MHSVISLSATSIVIRTRLTMSPHVPSAFLQSELVDPLAKPKKSLGREVKVHLDEFVHEDE